MTENKEDVLFDKAKFGIEVERFLSQPIGRYLIDRAERESEEAIKDMKSVDVTDTQKCRDIQERLNIPDKIMYWLAEAIDEGRVSEYQLREIGE